MTTRWLNPITLCALALLLAARCASSAETPPASIIPATPQTDSAVKQSSYTLPAAYTTPVHTGCSQFAEFEPTPGLPRLGPPCGACEVGWFAGRLWYEAEYLAWNTKGADFPALLTTGDAATPMADAGALDQGDTVVLFGQTRLHDDIRSGGRFAVGFWTTPEQRTGIEASIMGIDGRDVELHASSDDFPVLARPYTDAVGGDEDSLLIAYPGVLDGSTRIDADLELVGAEVLLRQALLWREHGRVDVVAGYRHGYLFDRLVVHDSSVSLDPSSGYPIDTVIDREDLFRTKNYFHGGEIGLATRMWRGCWSMLLTTKAAYGGTHTRSTIAGSTDTTSANFGAPVFTHDPGGLLGLDTNSAFREFNDDTFIGELGLKVEYQISTNSRLALGYTFFYWDSVVRLAPLIDTTINPTQLPPGTLTGAARPTFVLSRDDFWAQGINASFEHQF